MQTSLIYKKEKKQRHVRSGHQEIFCKKSLLKILQNSQNAETPVLESLPYNVIAGIQAVNFIQKRLQRRCFYANLSKF